MSSEPEEERKDGFRPRRLRPKGWLKKAIADGSVRDPALGPNPPEEHDPNATIIRPDVMRASAKQEAPGG